MQTCPSSSFGSVFPFDGAKPTQISKECPNWKHWFRVLGLFDFWGVKETCPAACQELKLLSTSFECATMEGLCKHIPVFNQWQTQLSNFLSTCSVHANGSWNSNFQHKDSGGGSSLYRTHFYSEHSRNIMQEYCDENEEMFCCKYVTPQWRPNYPFPFLQWYW